MQTSRTLRDAEEKTRIKVRPCFDPYWLVKGFTAFAPVRFTMRLTLKSEKWGSKTYIACALYTGGGGGGRAARTRTHTRATRVRAQQRVQSVADCFRYAPKGFKILLLRALLACHRGSSAFVGCNTHAGPREVNIAKTMP